MAKKGKTTKTLPMRALEERGVPYQVHAHARKLYTAEDVAEDLGMPVARVVKAMIVRRSDRSFALAVVPGDKRLSLKKLGEVLDDKAVELALERDVQRVTGFQVGAVSVLGFRREDIPAYVDEGVVGLGKIIISAGRPDSALEVEPEPLIAAIGAHVADLAT